MALKLPITFENYEENMYSIIETSEFQESDILYWQYQWRFDTAGYIKWLNMFFSHTGESELIFDLEDEGTEEGEDKVETLAVGDEPLFIQQADLRQMDFTIDPETIKTHAKWMKELSDHLGSGFEYGEETITHKKRVEYRSPSTTRLNNDLPDIHPDQFSFLDDPELQDIFLLAYSERKLYQSGLKKKFIDVETKIQTKSKNGPLIICLDTSGSMDAGTLYKPIEIGKMIAYELTMNAAKDGREVMMIEFSSQLQHFYIDDIEKQYEDFLFYWKQIVWGGTNVEIAIEFALETIEEKNWKDADILAISDMHVYYDDDFVKEVQKAHVSGTKLIGLNIDGYGLGEPEDREVSNEIFNRIFTLDDPNSPQRLYKEMQQYFSN